VNGQWAKDEKSTFINIYSPFTIDHSQIAARQNNLLREIADKYHIGLRYYINKKHYFV